MKHDDRAEIGANIARATEGMLQAAMKGDEAERRRCQTRRLQLIRQIERIDRPAPRRIKVEAACTAVLARGRGCHRSRPRGWRG